MRLFIAVNCSHKTRALLSAFGDVLRAHAERGNFSRPEQLHLTLVFLGECDPGQAAVAEHAVRTLRVAPFSVTISGGGYLDKGRPNLVFCGMKNDGGYDKLRRLQSDLRVNLSAKGLKLDQRGFWPHITLGRGVVWRDTGAFSSFIDLPFPTIEEPVTGVALMKSERVGGRLIYTPVFEKRLQ